MPLITSKELFEKAYSEGEAESVGKPVYRKTRRRGALIHPSVGADPCVCPNKVRFASLRKQKKT